MKSRFLVGLSAITCLAALTMPIRLAAQDKAEADRKHHHYKLIDVGTLGGPQSFSQEGNAESASAVLWENENGQIVDLNTLVAPGSGLALYWARYINDRGEISAYAADSNGNNLDVLLIPCDAAHPSTDGGKAERIEAAARTQLGGEGCQRRNVTGTSVHVRFLVSGVKLA